MNSELRLFVALTLCLACGNESHPDPDSAAGTGGFGSGGSSLAGGAGSAGSAGANGEAGAGIAGSGGSFGGMEIPGLDPSACAGPLPEAVFGLSSGSAVLQPGPYVVLTGTLPPSIDGSPVGKVEVRGSTRGVRIDAERKTWSFFLAAPAGNVKIDASAASGAVAEPLTTEVTLTGEALPDRNIEQGRRSLGTWMFSWFTGDPSWECRSPWRPRSGFESWDGSAAWAREQLLDQIDARMDLVGLQLDTASDGGDEGYRFRNVVHVLEAAHELMKEGVLPPRLFPFLDTALIADHYQASQGEVLDLASEAGRAYFYAHAKAFYDAAASTLGSTWLGAGVARFHAGLPAVAAWHSESMTGVDDAALLDFKQRFTADFGSSCYFIGHPNRWGDLAGVDEITQMLGPPAHLLEVGRDTAGLPTLNLTPGFWNPLSSASYLPREQGTHYETAWQAALAKRDASRRIWIDTWNETGEGSGIFAAEPTTYTAEDAGPCGDFENRQADSWGPDDRHYIDVTRSHAGAWSDSEDFDALPVASDLPDRMRPGERRYVTIVMRNTGDLSWTTENQKMGITFSAAARDFHIASLVSAQTDELTQRFGGVPRGMSGVFTVLMTAPCTPGTHLIAFEIYDIVGGGFGTQLRKEIVVTP